MNIEEFTRQSLVQIINGVIKAQEDVKASGASIAPRGFVSGENLRQGSATAMRHVQKVKMSVAVNVVENSEIKGGAGLISVVSLGLSGKMADVNSSTSRIDFEVPICLPQMDL